LYTVDYRGYTDIRLSWTTFNLTISRRLRYWYDW